MPYHLKAFRGLSGLTQVADDWSRLTQQMAGAHFFHQPQWYEAYLKNLADRPDDVVFCVIYNDATPVALLPLKQERRSARGVSIRTLELPRHDNLHLRDILVADDARSALSLSTIVNLLKGQRELRWDILALWHVLEDSCTMSAYGVKAPGLARSLERFGCWVTPLTAWEKLHGSLSKNFRGNLNRWANGAKKIGDTRFESVNTLPQLEAALDEFLAVEASGWKGKEGTAIKCDPKLTGFYRDLVRSFGARQCCEILLFKHGEKPIGGLFFLISGDTIYMPKCAYVEEYSKITPTHQLFEQFFRRCEQRPELKNFNFTSDAEWFDKWQPQRSAVHNVYVFNSTILGLAAAAGMGLVESFRRRPQPQAKAA